MTSVKRTQVIVGNLEIDFNEKFNQITIHKADLMPHVGMQTIPQEAELFWGTAEQLEDFLGRAWKKYRHLYSKKEG